MDDSSGEAAAAHSQAHGWSSYSLSLPSPPPDIRNWFPSYEYESPEASELVACPGGHSSSETQDPFEHSVFPRDDGVAVRKNRLGGQSENRLFDRKDLVPADGNESAVKKPPKRKQSLRALFGFLDKHEEDTESEFQVALPVQRNELEPLPICNATGLFDANQSQEGSINRSKVPVDYNGISSVDTQVSSPADQEVQCSELPVPCGSSLADNQKYFLKRSIDSIEHGKVLVDCEGMCSVETQVSSLVDKELEYCKLPVNCVSSSLSDIQKCLPEDSTDSIEHNKVPVNPDGISSADTQVSSPADQEVEYSKQSVTTIVSGLADIQQEDGPGSFETAINFLGTNLSNTEKGSRDGSEHSMLPVCHDSIILADTNENSPVKDIGHCKPALDSKGPEQTVASDGFIAVKRKHRLPEECETNKIPKYPMRRDRAPLQENHDVLGQKVLAQREDTRSPLTDTTNFTEAAAAPTAEFRGKWKCPAQGKPHVGPPMKQLRLDQWLR